MRYETKKEYHDRMINQEKHDINRNNPRKFVDIDNHEAQETQSDLDDWNDRCNVAMDDYL